MAKLKFIAGDVGLRDPVADGQRQIDADAISGKCALENLIEHGAVIAVDAGEWTGAGGVLRSRQSAVLECSDEVELGKQFVPCSFQTDLRVGQLQFGGLIFGAVLKREGDDLRGGLGGQGLESQSIGRNDTRVVNGWIAGPVARKHGLQNQFLLADVALGIDEVLLGRCYLRLGARGLDGRERSLIDLVVVVFEEALGGIEGFLLHVHIRVEAHEVVIEADDAGNGADDLLLKDIVGNLLTVLGDVDEPAVEVRSEATKQRLGYGDSERGKRIGVDDIGEGNLILVLILKSGGDLSARAEALEVTDVSDEGVRCLIGESGDSQIGFRSVGALAQYFRGEGGIVEGNGGAAGEGKGSGDAEIILRFGNELGIGDGDGND